MITTILLVAAARLGFDGLDRHAETLSLTDQA